jgi:hypothetical protein
MADDDLDDFSDDDFDDLPANALDDLEASAIRATQQPQQQQLLFDPEADSDDYGLEDGDEVVNLDDASGPPRASQDYDYAYDYDHNQNGDGQTYNGQMEVEEQPRPSQADPNALLQRIKKVRCLPLRFPLVSLNIAVRARQGAREKRSRRAEREATDKVGRGRHPSKTLRCRKSSTRAPAGRPAAGPRY